MNVILTVIRKGFETILFWGWDKQFSPAEWRGAQSIYNGEFDPGSG
jgi:hypothetical protein